MRCRRAPRRPPPRCGSSGSWVLRDSFVSAGFRSGQELHRRTAARAALDIRRKRRQGLPVVTPDEIAQVPLFEQLDAAQREQLSRVAADINLATGEYAAPQGSEPALFAVLDGRIEPVMRREGVERVVGRREPGEIFGEVPITLGTVFPVGFRAAIPSRVMRIEPRDYHAVASGSPDVAKEVGRLASHRMSGLRGLQGLAADPPPPRAIVLGRRLDPACTELRAFLTRNQVTFRSEE